MENTINEIISPSGKYKAIVTEREECNSIDVYILFYDYDPIDNISHGEYWSRKNSSPIFVDKGLHAGHFAIQELRKLMDEPERNPTIEWIRDYSFCQGAKFIDPKEVSVFCDFVDGGSDGTDKDKIEVRAIICFDGLCLVEETGDEGNWQMGQVDSNGNIYCWGYYGGIKEAIKAL